MATTRTRTRQSTSTKATETAAATDDTAARAAAKAAEQAEKDAAKAAEKSQKDAERAEAAASAFAKKAADKAEREAEKEAAKAEKEQIKIAERQELLDSGDLIIDGDTEYVATEPKKETVALRAKSVIEDLMLDGTEIPVSGKDLADKYGGGTVQWVAFFGMLRVMGLIRNYRSRTGERGGSSGCYLWIGPDSDVLAEDTDTDSDA